MDMKKILQAFDGAADKPKVEASDMKKFLSIVTEGKGPLNRLTTAESMAVKHYTESKPTSITSPVLNVTKDAKPSMIGKYFKSVEEEFLESSGRSKERVRQLAERVIEKLSPEMPDLSEPDAVDTVTVDIPLLLRLLEYAKEDAKTDMDLHNVTEKLISLSKEYDSLSMDQYDAIVGEQPALPAPDEQV
jgi:hypothetical protein